MEHEFYLTWFTGNIVCERCKLLPLDADDYDSPCEPDE